MTNNEKARLQRPEGKLLERAMAGPPKISGRQLAKKAGLSEGRVRQIINGYKSEAGMQLPVVAPAETLARLSEVLGLTADDLEGVARSDAAAVVRGDLTSGVTESGELWLADLNHLRIELQEWLEAGIESDPPPGPLMLWQMDALLDAVGRKHRDETDFLNNVVKLYRDRTKEGDGNVDGEARGSAQISGVTELSDVAPTLKIVAKPGGLEPEDGDLNDT